MRVRSGISVAAAAAVLAVVPSSALASDASSTQTYLQADYKLVRTAAAGVAAAERAPLLLLAKVQRECPAAAAHSPQDQQSTQMSDEVIGAMVTAAYRPKLPAIRSFVRSVSGLRWSSGALTREVREYAKALRTLTGLAEPALCADMGSWAASSFNALSAATVSFDARFMPAWVGIGNVFGGRLTRSETSQSRSLAARAAPLEERITQAELNAVESWGKIMNALELWP